MVNIDTLYTVEIVNIGDPLLSILSTLVLHTQRSYLTYHTVVQQLVWTILLQRASQGKNVFACFDERNSIDRTSKRSYPSDTDSGKVSKRLRSTGVRANVDPNYDDLRLYILNTLDTSATVSALLRNPQSLHRNLALTLCLYAELCMRRRKEQNHDFPLCFSQLLYGLAQLSVYF